MVSCPQWRRTCRGRCKPWRFALLAMPMNSACGFVVPSQPNKASRNRRDLPTTRRDGFAVDQSSFSRQLARKKCLPGAPSRKLATVKLELTGRATDSLLPTKPSWFWTLALTTNGNCYLPCRVLVRYVARASTPGCDGRILIGPIIGLLCAAPRQSITKGTIPALCLSLPSCGHT